MKIVAVTQARLGSSRLPGKVLKQIQNKTLLQIHLERILQSKQINKLLVATTKEQGTEKIVSIARQLGVTAYQGSVDDVLDRFYQALQAEAPEYVVRLTSDCPLIDAALIDQVIEHVVSSGADYGSNTLQPTYPDGQDVEVFKFSALEQAWGQAQLKSEREHVTPFIWKNSTHFQKSLFSSYNFSSPTDYSQVRLTVDEQSDLDVVTTLVQQLGFNATWLQYTHYYLRNVEDMINKAIKRNEGFEKSLLTD